MTDTTPIAPVTQADIEPDAWEWLAKMVSALCDEEPSDLTYSADQMVDAYIAGALARQRSASPSGLVEQHGEALHELSSYLKDLLTADYRAAEAYEKVVKTFGTLTAAPATAGEGNQTRRTNPEQSA